MIDITDKKVSSRMAIAEGYIQFSNEISIEQVTSNSNKKGDVISLARISALSAVKKTSDLIILCHPLPLTKASVTVEIISPMKLRVECQVKCEGKTGVEMEALTGVAAGLLNVYDMCKAVDKGMTIEGVQVVEKRGGKSDYGSKVL
jgi:molybdenum cofactor biosynthesis protein MoaC